MERSEVYKLIDGERDYQDAKWGTIEQNPHSVYEWTFILEEELGEAQQKALHGLDHDALDELRQVAAVCIAALEQYGCTPRQA